MEGPSLDTASRLYAFLASPEDDAVRGEQERAAAQPHDAYVVVIGDEGDGFENVLPPSSSPAFLSVLPITYRAIQQQKRVMSGADEQPEVQEELTTHVWHVRRPTSLPTEEDVDHEASLAKRVASLVHDCMRAQAMQDDAIKAMGLLAVPKKGGKAAPSLSPGDAAVASAMARTCVAIAVDGSKPWELHASMQACAALAKAIAEQLQAPLTEETRVRLRLVQRLRVQVGGAPGLLAASQTELLQRCIAEAHKAQESEEAGAIAEGAGSSANSSSSSSSSAAVSVQLSSEGVTRAASAALQSFSSRLPSVMQLADLLPPPRHHELTESIGLPTSIVLTRSEHLLPLSSSSSSSSASSSATSDKLSDAGAPGAVLLKAMAGDQTEHPLLRQLASTDLDLKAAMSSSSSSGAASNGIMSLAAVAAARAASGGKGDNEDDGLGSTDALLAKLEAARGEDNEGGAGDGDDEEEEDAVEGGSQGTGAGGRKAINAMIQEFLSIPTSADELSKRSFTSEVALALAWLATQKLHLPQTAFESSYLLAVIRLQAIKTGAACFSIPSPSSGLESSGSGPSERLWSFLREQLVTASSESALVMRACLPLPAPTAAAEPSGSAATGEGSSADAEGASQATAQETIRAAILRALLSLPGASSTAASAASIAPETSVAWKVFLPFGADSLAMLTDSLAASAAAGAGGTTLEARLRALLEGAGVDAAGDASELVAAALSDASVFKRVSGDVRPKELLSADDKDRPSSSLLEAITRPGGDEPMQQALRHYYNTANNSSAMAGFTIAQQGRLAAEATAALVVSRLVEEPHYPTSGEFLSDMYDLQQAGLQAQQGLQAGGAAAASTPKGSPAAGSRSETPLSGRSGGKGAADTTDALLSQLESLSVSASSSSSAAGGATSVGGVGAASTGGGLPPRAVAVGGGLSVKAGGAGTPVAAGDTAGTAGSGTVSTPGAASGGAEKAKDPRAFFQNLIKKK